MADSPPPQSRLRRGPWPVLVAFVLGVVLTAWWLKRSDPDGSPTSVAEPEASRIAAGTADSVQARAPHEAAMDPPSRPLDGATVPPGLGPKGSATPGAGAAAEEENGARAGARVPGSVDLGSAGEAAPESGGAAVAGGGIDGRVRLTGAVPSERPLTSVDGPCAALLGPRPQTDRYTITDGNVAGVFVQLLDPPPFTGPPPSAEVVLDQRGCRFVPKVLAVQRLQTLRILNSDDTLHNVHAMATRGEFNTAMPKQGQVIRKAFREAPVDATGRASPIPIVCDVHKFMSAHLFVMPHPYFGISDEKGQLHLPPVPDGTYHFSAWHEGFEDGPWQRGTVQVVDGIGLIEIDLSGVPPRG